LNDLFEISQTRADSITYDVKVQMIEIYNEQVRDLLMTDGANKRYPFLCQVILLFLNNKYHNMNKVVIVKIVTDMYFMLKISLYIFFEPRSFHIPTHF